jgi:hypothetical protein
MWARMQTSEDLSLQQHLKHLLEIWESLRSPPAASSKESGASSHLHHRVGHKSEPEKSPSIRGEHYFVAMP